MTTINYKLGDTYPNIKGVVSYSGSVQTDSMTAELLANSKSTGPFTGAVTRTGGDSGNPSLSTFEWLYYVNDDDTNAEGAYELCLQIIHVGGEKETINLDTTATVSGDCG